MTFVEGIAGRAARDKITAVSALGDPRYDTHTYTRTRPGSSAIATAPNMKTQHRCDPQFEQTAKPTGAIF
jgi:hypothetical protein